MRFPTTFRRARAQTLRLRGRVPQGLLEVRRPPQGLTMKRMLAPRGKTLPRSSLWRPTYSLINLTSSSSGKRLAFKPEASSSSQNAHSHTFQMPVCVKGNLRASHSTEKGRAAIARLPRTGQCARAGSPAGFQSRRGAWPEAGPRPPQEWRGSISKRQNSEDPWKPAAALTGADGWVTRVQPFI